VAPAARTPSPGGGLAPGDSYATRKSVVGAANLSAAELMGWPTVPGYEIEDELGRGGMGVVYKARQAGLGRLVALKMILHADHAGTEGRARFFAEPEAVARLQHPNIVQIHEIGEHDGAPFFSLEFCPGGSLDRKLAHKPAPVREAAALVRTLAEAVQAAHGKGIIHRDLKPANVLLGEDGTLKVTDFGLAKRLDQAGETRAGAVMGTPNYMAPEQAEGKTDQIGPAADVYALGAILYECLTGRPPFLASSVLEVLDQVRSAEPLPPRRLQVNVPRDLETICLKCLQKAPAARYASAADLAADLDRYLDGRPILARPVPAWERTAKWARRHPAQAGLAVAVLLVVAFASLGGTFYGLYKDRENVLLRQQAEQKERFRDSFSRGKEEEAAASLARERKQDDQAHKHLEAADRLLESAERDAADPDQREDVAGRRQRVRQALVALDLRLQMQPRINRLLKGCDDVHFHEISPTGRDRSDNLALVCRLAPPALADFGITRDRTPAEEVAALQSERDRFRSPALLKQVAETCYDLLLSWAEAERGLLAGQTPAQAETSARRALRLLDLAAALGQAHGIEAPQAYHLRRARYLARVGHKKGAEAEATRVATMKPHTALDHFLAALEHARQEDNAAAVDSCSLALLEQPGHFWARYLQALCQVKRKRWSEAEVALTACLGRRPDFLWAALLRGVAHAGMEQFGAAEADFARALALAKQARDPLARYVVLTNRAVLWARQKRWDAAVADLHEAIALRPGNYQAYESLAGVCRKRNDLAGAIAALDRAIACRPEEVRLIYTRARVYLDRGDGAKARQDLEHAIRIARPEHDRDLLLSAHVELAGIEHRAGDFQKALASCDAALALQKNYPPAHRQRAQTLLALNRPREAGLALDLYLAHTKAIVKEDAAIYLARGEIHNQLREYTRAVDALTRALMLRNDAETLTQRGWAYLQLKAPELALADFDASLKLRPAHATTLCGRGTARVLLGHMAGGIADAEAALHLSVNAEQELLAACIYARAAGLLALTEHQRGAVRPEALYEDRAAELLCQALQRVPDKARAAFWRNHVQREPVLESVRRLPQVVRLTASVRPVLQ
jgi:tetratricopeptide (TPR) repeat protein/tRNA A-37 threonylcarbamoyl transferase component Bud32